MLNKKNQIMDAIRPKKTVEVDCEKCAWSFWLHHSDFRLPDGPFLCSSCDGSDQSVYVQKVED